MKLNELFTDPYRIRWNEPNDGEMIARFATDQDTNIKVSFDYEALNVWYVSFDAEYLDANGTPVKTFLKTGEGDAPRIFATVIKAIQEFILKVKPKYLHFAAANSEPSRVKLYRVMVTKFGGSNFEKITDPEQATDLPQRFKAYLSNNPKGYTHFILLNKNYGSIKEVEIDNVNGAGAVPDNQNVDYRGLRVMMKPSMFLKLAHKLDNPHSAEGLAQHIQRGGSIGSPFLSIQLPYEWFDYGDFEKSPKVVSHEGRNRMNAILQVEGDIPVEVHLFFRGEVRARHLTPEIIERLQYNYKGIYNQDGKFVLDRPLFQLVNKQPLNELFAKTYPVEREDEMTFAFDTDAGKYRVLIVPDEIEIDDGEIVRGVWLEFGLTGGDYGYNFYKTNTGNAFSVFATIGKTLKTYLNHNPDVNWIEFTAGNIEPSRVKLYDAFMRMLPKQLDNWTLYKREIKSFEVRYVLNKVGAV